MNKISSYCFILLLVLTGHKFFYGQQINAIGDNEVYTYAETIALYQSMASQSSNAELITIGSSDVGKPLNLFVINEDQEFNIDKLSNKKAILFINNGIHPGEPCGVKASIQFAEALLHDTKYKKMLENTIVCILPLYNIGGALNRGCCSRANQNGPEEYGFRGNAKNLDLNRDFIKMDSENAKGFEEAFRKIRPHFFIDTHTSNGADYQYTMTMITTQPDKLGGNLEKVVRQEVNPALYRAMKTKHWEMIPYVHLVGRTPEEGILDFLETPRYSTGYTALFNTIGFTSETHMFKPFSDRVQSTLDFEFSVLEYMNKHASEIIQDKEQADQALQHSSRYVVKWRLDTLHYDTLKFLGFESSFISSELTGEKRLFYDRKKPKEFLINYYNRYLPEITIDLPKKYIIPQAWHDVIARLKLNGVEMIPIAKDTILAVEAYHILDYHSPKTPYEGHYLHKEVKVEIVQEEVRFYAGDWVINPRQEAGRYVVETLEPQSPDSFFAWNFFDSCLQQKEWFSDYVFEEKAVEILENDPELKNEFETKKLRDSKFSNNHWAQLYWIYQHSGFYESTVNRLPVYRYSGDI